MLVRAGHTVAAVAISRLAGLSPVGVICEIMKDDGSMARLPDLVSCAQPHGLKIGAVADLIAYRQRTERQVERVLETPFDSAFGGRFRMVIYRNVIDPTEHVVLAKGRIEAKADPGADAPGWFNRRHSGPCEDQAAAYPQRLERHRRPRGHRRRRVHPRSQPGLGRRRGMGARLDLNPFQDGFEHPACVLIGQAFHISVLR